LARHYKYMCAGKTFVYVDESGFSPTTERDYGWALRGQKVHGFRSGNRRPRTSLIAARIGRHFDAPMLFDGTTNTAIFNAWLEQELCPKLNHHHVVVMDNAAFHKSAKTRELIEGTGAILMFLPPYSPDLNPIEHDFANIKKRRKYDHQNTLDTIVSMYNY
jgi:thymidine kinase